MATPRLYLCDWCAEALTTHATAVRGVEEAICDACLGPPLRMGLSDADIAHEAGLARAQRFLRKRTYWGEES